MSYKKLYKKYPMTSFFNKTISMRSTTAIAEFAMPLRAFGVSGFVHDITFERGGIVILSDTPSLIRYYYRHALPALCTNDEGRYLLPGIYVNYTLQRQHEDYAHLFPVVSEQFHFQQLIHFVEKEEDCQHLYSFMLSLSEIDFLQFTASHIIQLHTFIENYKSRARFIIHEAKQKKNRFILPISNPMEDNEKLAILKKPSELAKPLAIAHKNTRTMVPLSFQQEKCLQLLLRGHKNSVIANKLQLSTRTVENYFLNMRKKLGCRCNKELVALYYQTDIDEKYRHPHHFATFEN